MKQAGGAATREVVLVGGGHAHVQVIRRMMMEPWEGARVTVIVDRPVAVYSGMVPGFVAGDYRAADVEIDVWPLARRAGVRVIVAAATGVDVGARRIEVEGRPPIAYDLASFDIGSTVAGLDLPGVRAHALATRPIGRFVGELDARLAGRVAPRVVVVGAGAGGVELAFTLQHRTRGTVTLLDAHPAPLRGAAPSLVARVRRAAARRGITLRADARVLSVEADRVVLADGELPFDVLVWATGAAAHPLAGDLPRDARGFLRVGPTLQLDGHPELFAVGDCAAFGPRPLPKAGVYAVRAGPILADNLRAAVAGRPLRDWSPQTDFLALLNLGDGTAIGCRNGVSFEGPWVWRWKDHIDRKFMRMFQVLGPDDRPSPDFPAMDPADEMVCGGCAAKVGPADLVGSLGRLPPRRDPSVELGLDPPDDAAVVRAPDGTRIVLSVDGFSSFLDDPFLVGRAAAANAVNDLYAKGVRPRWALAWVGVPERGAGESLFQVMAGIRHTLDALDVTLVGGHSMRTEGLTVGLSVTGVLEEAPRTLDRLRSGDALVLGGALGTGVLFRADMLGRTHAAWTLAALPPMMRAHRDALAISRPFDISAATDVTGFGFAGHLLPMLSRTGLAATVDLHAIPLLPGVAALLDDGVLSTFHAQNRALAVDVELPDGLPRAEILFDPQTCGPLLFAVSPDQADTLVAALRAEGLDAARVGEVGPAGVGRRLRARAGGVRV